MSREASLQELLNSAITTKLEDTHTAIPCIVVAVRDNLQGAMVDIQPTINQKFRSGETKERPVILGVPVQFQVSKTAGFTFPVRVGDTGLAIFSMRNLDAWKSGNGSPATPLNFAAMDKGDAIFVPGLQPPGVSVNNPSKHINTHSTDDAVIFNNLGTESENEVRLHQNGDISINTNQNVFVNCNNATVTAQSTIDMTCSDFILDATNSISLTAPTASISIGDTTWSGNISQSGNYTGTGVQTFNGVIFSSHDHIPGPGPSNP